MFDHTCRRASFKKISVSMPTRALLMVAWAVRDTKDSQKTLKKQSKDIQKTVKRQLKDSQKAANGKHRKE